ncbi:BamA/TamA family outer membrane protein, partial [Pseudomonas sp. SIMBA_077]
PSRGVGVTGNVGTAADPDQDPLPFGGNVLIQGGAELLFPLPFVKDQRSLRTSLFWDVGNVFNSRCESTSNTIAASNVKTQCN